MLLDFIAQAAKKYHTEPDKVFLVGFSQGAIMSYEVALRHPEAVGGIAALSGRILPVLKSALKPDEKRQTLAIFIGHGKEDNRLPYKDGTEADSLLQSMSLKPEFHAYEVSATPSAPPRSGFERLVAAPQPLRLICR